MKIKLDPLDILFSYRMRLGADNHCEYCGQWKEMGKLQVSHFIGRRYKAVRWDEDNVSVVCFTCHRYLEDHPDIHTEWFGKRLGSERLEQLTIKSNTIKPDKEAIKSQLKEKIKSLEG